MSRWLSAATPPEHSPSLFLHPGGMPEGVALRRNSPRVGGASAIPPGWRTGGRLLPVVSLTLNHRLIAVTPAGVDWCSRPLRIFAQRAHIFEVSHLGIAMKIELGMVIAERILEVPGHPNLDIRVKIGQPRPFPDDPEEKDFYCPYQITGIDDEKVRYMGGMDSMQALMLAIKILPVHLDLIRRDYLGLRWLELPAGQYGIDSMRPSIDESDEVTESPHDYLCRTPIGGSPHYARPSRVHSPTVGILPPLPRERRGIHLVPDSGERVGVRGPYRSFWPPHPGPLPHSGVHSESLADCGGEGAEMAEYRQLGNAPRSPELHP